MVEVIVLEKRNQPRLLVFVRTFGAKELIEVINSFTISNFVRAMGLCALYIVLLMSLHSLKTMNNYKLLMDKLKHST